MVSRWNSVLSLCILCILAIFGLAATPIRPGWISVVVGSLFEVNAPSGSYFTKQSGADSFAGRLVGPAFELQIDYGAYADPLTDKSRFAQYSANSIRIDGKPAIIVRATLTGAAVERNTFIGVHVSELGQSGRGSISLTMSGIVSDTEREALVLEIFSSIRFKTPQ